MDFSFVALEAGFVAKRFARAGVLVADVWAGVFVLMSPV
jgi:hypothetical protein